MSLVTDGYQQIHLFYHRIPCLCPVSYFCEESQRKDMLPFVLVAMSAFVALFVSCVFLFQIVAVTKDDSTAAPSPHPAIPRPLCCTERGQDSHHCWRQGRQRMMIAPCSRHHALHSGLSAGGGYCEMEMKGMRKIASSAIFREVISLCAACCKEVTFRSLRGWERGHHLDAEKGL